jgi:hypothetical protein
VLQVVSFTERKIWYCRISMPLVWPFLVALILILLCRIKHRLLCLCLCPSINILSFLGSPPHRRLAPIIHRARWMLNLFCSESITKFRHQVLDDHSVMRLSRSQLHLMPCASLLCRRAADDSGFSTMLSHRSPPLPPNDRTQPLNPPPLASLLLLPPFEPER